MTDISGILLFVLLVMMIVILARSFGRGKPLATVPDDPVKVSGVFTLILYGGTHSNDLETLAILDREDDQVSFEPFAPEFKYRIKKGLSAKEALEEAGRFVAWHRDFHRSELRGILDERGHTIGYELRPIYLPISFGVDDVVDVGYSMEKNRVTVTIRLKPAIERMQL